MFRALTTIRVQVITVVPHRRMLICAHIGRLKKTSLFLNTQAACLLKILYQNSRWLQAMLNLTNCSDQPSTSRCRKNCLQQSSYRPSDSPSFYGAGLYSRKQGHNFRNFRSLKFQKCMINRCLHYNIFGNLYFYYLSNKIRC